MMTGRARRRVGFPALAEACDRVASILAGTWVGITLVAGARVLPVGDEAALVVVGAVMATVGAACVGSLRELRLRTYGWSAAVGAIAVLLIMGAVRLGWLFVALGVAVSTVALASSLHRRRGLVRAAAPGDPNGSPGRVSLLRADEAAEELSVSESLEDLDLCRAWCSSFVALQRAETFGARQRIVAERAALLDELERRHPVELGDWLRSGARAAANPQRHLLGDECRHDPGCV